jgi:Ca-activated chloride channel family protein
MRDLSYAWPEAAYLFFLVFPFLGLLWTLYLYRNKIVEMFTSAGVGESILMRRSKLFFFLKALGLNLVWVALVLALMQPRGHSRYASLSDDEEQVVDERLLEETDELSTVLERRKAHDLIFMLDTSASMEVKDTRTGKSRLDFAKDIIDEITSQLDGQSVALYAFTSEIAPVVPLTYDYLFLRLALRSIKVNMGDVAGTDLVESLDMVRKRHFSGQDKITTLLILTDGGDTHLETLSGQERETQIQTILSRLGKPEENQVRVFTIGLGSAEGSVIPDLTYNGKAVTSSLDEELLNRLSEKGRGRYYSSNRFSTLSIASDLLEMIRKDDRYVEEELSNTKLLRVERTLSEEREVSFDLYFQYPLAVAIVLLTFILLGPDVRKRRKI